MVSHHTGTPQPFSSSIILADGRQLCDHYQDARPEMQCWLAETSHPNRYIIVNPSQPAVSRTSSAAFASIAAMYESLKLEAVQQRAAQFAGLPHAVPILRAYLAGAFDEATHVTFAAPDTRRWAFTDSKRTLSKVGKKRPALSLKALIGQFASLDGLTIGEVFEHRHPLLDRFITRHNGTGPSTISMTSLDQLDYTGTTPARSNVPAMFESLKLEAVQQRAEQFAGLPHAVPILRAYLAGAFDEATYVTFAAPDSRRLALTDSKRSLVTVNGKQPKLTVKALIPAVGQFASLEGLTIGEVFGRKLPLLDQFVGLSKRCNPTIIYGGTASQSAALLTIYKGLDQEVVQQRAQVYNGLTLPPAVLRAYLAGAFDDVDSVIHAKTGETHQFMAGKQSLVGNKNVSGQLLVPTVGDFAAFGHCTIAAAFRANFSLLDHFIKQASCSKHTIVSTTTRAVKPRRTATSAKRGRGKSTATAPTHGLMTPLLLPPTTQPAKHAKLVIPPGHHPHPCVTY
jgi:hypothetical protein